MKLSNSPRELRGLAILSKGNMIEMQWEDNYMVDSQSGNGKYWVHKYRKRWKCSCPDFEKRKMECKHIFAVKFSNTLKNYVEEDHLI